MAKEVPMQKESVQTILRTLNTASVRYLIAGGLAVVAHAYLRFTADMDLILDIEESNVRRALAALMGLGLPTATAGAYGAVCRSRGSR